MDVPEITYQQGDEDYVDEADPGWVVERVRAGLASADGFHCSVYLAGVTSDTPHLFVGRARAGGAVVSCRLWEPAFVPGVGFGGWYASTPGGDQEAVAARFGCTRMRVPGWLLVPPATAAECAGHFMALCELHPAVEWVRYSDIAFPLFTAD
jgi:hypothetical protein